MNSEEVHLDFLSVEAFGHQPLQSVMLEVMGKDFPHFLADDYVIDVLLQPSPHRLV